MLALFEFIKNLFYAKKEYPFQAVTESVEVVLAQFAGVVFRTCLYRVFLTFIDAAAPQKLAFVPRWFTLRTVLLAFLQMGSPSVYHQTQLGTVKVGEPVPADPILSNRLIIIQWIL